MKKQWGRRLVFAQGTVWEPWIQWHKVGTHIRVVTRPTSHPPHTSRTSKTFGSVCYCTWWNRCVYFDRLLGSTWRTPSWRTNRSRPALIHLFGDLLLTFLSLHYSLTSCCMLWQISSPPDIFLLTFSGRLMHFPPHIFQETDADAVWCIIRCTYTTLYKELRFQDWEFHITITKWICTNLEDELAGKLQDQHYYW